jgi:uncharacterized coiled-coil protein SlyX
MAEHDNLDGINPVGQIPGIYINRSNFHLTPLPDTDFMSMIRLVPVMFSDLNFAAMMQAFSILYGINVVTENLTMSPNKFWQFNQDPTLDVVPQVGMIKPEVNIAEMQEYIMKLLSFWLSTRNVKAGTVGRADDSLSGISKMIDEADTSADRQKQVVHFQRAEDDLWELITRKLHPYWVKNKMINTQLEWSPNVEIKIDFPEQLPLIDRSKILEDSLKELEADLTLPEIVIHKLNPTLTESEVEDLYNEITERRSQSIQIPIIEPENDESLVEENDSGATESQN